MHFCSQCSCAASVRLADRIGGKRVYRAGLTGFALTSLACGLATDAVMLITLRALQGVAAAAMLHSSLALLNRATAHDARLRARAVHRKHPLCQPA